jgi:tetraacyldisaccharide 4'-kinase
MADTSVIDRLWFGNDVWARRARLALAPLEAVYAAVVGLRGMMYDTGFLRERETAIPSVGIGNLSVGGTGKTPFASWLAQTLAGRGARPAIVLRGYGEDEPLVHRVLNPTIPVIVDANRVRGTLQARAAGADVAVLDDAFQHRQARRAADFVLVSADRWSPEPHLLPAGPFREPLSALRRATAVVVTRKAAPRDVADFVAESISRIVPGMPHVVVELASRALVQLGGGGQHERPIADVAGREVRALLAIGDAQAFVRQLESHGARVVAKVFPDHHHFTDDEIASFIRGVPPEAIVVCTLKDAVKLEGRWPREAALPWYVSQHVVVERGIEHVDRVIDELMRVRAALPPTTG